jgi:hypothetical protein
MNEHVVGTGHSNPSQAACPPGSQRQKPAHAGALFLPVCRMRSDTLPLVGERVHPRLPVSRLQAWNSGEG